MRDIHCIKEDSLKNEPKDIKGFESLKQAVIKRNPNPLPDRCNCPHCQSTDVVKNGNRRGVQRFMCKECKRTFTYSTNTIVYKSSKSIEVWKKYCECFLNKCHSQVSLSSKQSTKLSNSQL